MKDSGLLIHSYITDRNPQWQTNIDKEYQWRKFADDTSTSFFIHQNPPRPRPRPLADPRTS